MDYDEAINYFNVQYMYLDSPHELVKSSWCR